jgi:hypothetical protein
MADIFFFAWQRQGPNRVEAPAHELRRLIDRVSALTNDQLQEPRSESPGVSLPYRLLMSGLDAVADLWTWYASVQGALKAVWLPTYQHDLTLATDVAAADTTLTITSPVGTPYGVRYFPVEARRHLALLVASGAGIGTVVHRRVTDAVAHDDGTETLTLDAAVGVDLSATYDMVSFLLYARLADDPVTVEWRTAGTGAVAETTLAFVELPREVPTSV